MITKRFFLTKENWRMGKKLVITLNPPILDAHSQKPGGRKSQRRRGGAIPWLT